MATLANMIRSAKASVYWFRTIGRWRLKDAFNDLYEGQIRSSTFRGIFRDAFGDEYAEEVEPCGFLSIRDLRKLVEYLNIKPDQKFVDLACGRGGTGLWLARDTGARLVGVDLAEVAVERASQRVHAFGLDGRAEFRVGDFAATGLPAASFDGAISIDSLYLVSDKVGSVRETARILKPGARFVFTTWELDLPGGISDYRPMITEAGFDIEAYDLTPHWEERQRRIHQGVLDHRETLVKEMGKSAANVWLRFATAELPKLSHMRRLMIAARKK